MILPLLVTAAGLLAPLPLRRLGRRGNTPRLVLCGQLVGLTLALAGVLALLDSAAGDEAHLWDISRRLSAGSASWEIDLRFAAAAVLATSMVARALWSAALHGWRSRAASRLVRRSGAMSVEGVLVVPGYGTVAASVGILRSLLVVDPEHFDHLQRGERQVVLAHERGHARGCHGLVALIARVLSDALRPWPLARVAYVDIRRQLEALADDHAARRLGRRRVAKALVRVAVAPEPRRALGASGWPLWRVQRLLLAPRVGAVTLVIGVMGIGTALTVSAQIVGHVAANVHVAPLLARICG